MPRYRIHRIKETPLENFRWTPHTGGETVVKPKDYEAGQTVEAATPYAAWKSLAEENQPLRPGDLLEICPAELSNETAPEALSLLIAKYIGFEPARWLVPELRNPDVTNEFALDFCRRSSESRRSRGILNRPDRCLFRSLLQTWRVDYREF